MSRDIIIKPLITEKTTRLSENLGKYAFLVDVGANKLEIQSAIEGMYSVNVMSVNTIISPRKSRSRFTSAGVLNGRTKLKKKAIITLAEGETIDFFEDV